MRVVIMGCGRVGAGLAARLDAEGHDVTLIDTESYAFTRYLPDTFGGVRIEGSGIDDRVLRQARVDRADVFMAMTGGDNRNLLASQKAKEIYGVQRAIARVKDPLRAELFERLGLRTFSPTTFGGEAAYAALVEPDSDAPAPDEPAASEPAASEAGA